MMKREGLLNEDHTTVLLICYGFSRKSLRAKLSVPCKRTSHAVCHCHGVTIPWLPEEILSTAQCVIQARLLRLLNNTDTEEVYGLSAVKICAISLVREVSGRFLGTQMLTWKRNLLMSTPGPPTTASNQD